MSILIIPASVYFDLASGSAEMIVSDMGFATVEVI